MSNPDTTPLSPVNTELFTRCAEYVRGWYGLEHLGGKPDGLTTQEQNQIGSVVIGMHNALHQRDEVSDERIAALGFRSIVQLQQQPEIYTDEIVSLVPRITRLRTCRPLSGIEQGQREHEAMFTRRAK